MPEIHKQFVFDKNGRAVAVQITLEEFQQIEEILAESEQVMFLPKSRNGSSKGDSSEDSQEECELVEVDGILVVKAQGAENIDIVEFIKEQREERIRQLGGW
jgi:hypothetical protein